MLMSEMKVKDEANYDLDWRKEGDAVKHIRILGILSLPTLQRLYLKYLKQDASNCQDVELLKRKLQYWFQRKCYRYHERPMSEALQLKTKRVLALPLPTSQEVIPMAKSALKKKAVAEEVEEVEEAEAAETEAEEPETGEEKTSKRVGHQSGTGKKVVRLRGKKFTGVYLYEILVKMFDANQTLHASDHAMAKAIREAWAGTNVEYGDYRIRADRVTYNRGKFKGQTSAPKTPLKEYNKEGKVVVREIPAQLKDYVKKGQPVAKTIAENRKKGLIPPKKKVIALKNEDERPKKSKSHTEEE